MVGVKLLILSLEEHIDDYSLHLCLPPEFANQLEDWVSRHSQSVRIHRFAPQTDGWSVKAEVLLYLLQEEPEVIWLDTDLIALRNPSHLFENYSDATLVTAQEFYSSFDPDSGYASAWGFSQERNLEAEVNTCVLRVTRDHIRLLKRWHSMLSSDKYTEVQARKFSERSRALCGDQPLLEALLVSDADSFSSIPVRHIRTGKDLIHDHRHFYSYKLVDRLANGFGFQSPTFVHCISFRPWMNDFRSLDGIEWTHGLQLKPYIQISKKYRDMIEEDVSSWMDYHTTYGRICQMATLYNPHLQGIGMWPLEKVTRWSRSFF